MAPRNSEFYGRSLPGPVSWSGAIQSRHGLTPAVTGVAARALAPPVQQGFAPGIEAEEAQHGSPLPRTYGMVAAD